MIPVAKPTLSGQEKNNVLQALDSGWISSTGEFVSAFEAGLARYLGTAQVATTSNGTTALHLALLALGVGPCDEVIVPACSFIATLNAVLYTGAEPVFVDIELDTWGLDPEQVRSKITKRTKAILAVHLYGFPCRITELNALAKEHGLFLVEDNAEAFGASVNGKKLGTIGDIGTYSFFGNKIITTGEGGAVSSDNATFMDRVRLYKNQGRKTNKIFQHEVLGYNYRMTNLQAAIGLAQLAQADDFIAARRHIESLYDARLAGLIYQPKDMPGAEHVNWLYTRMFNHKELDITALGGFLEQNGIDTRRVFSSMSSVAYLGPEYQRLNFPNTNRLHNLGLTLPTYVGLTDAEITQVTDAVNTFIRGL
ncbi:MAG: DegT/DnrJ/EryC1/StrS family aminotransferase [Candidatus Magasanikbacteria bacterium]|nr:DegT/DnrJ/EryC1/StrS family aminotransferase [Candidatus Magasanikbacteria bacterium]